MVGTANADGAPTSRQLFQRLVHAGDALNARIGELERVRAENWDLVTELRTARICLDAERKANADHRSTRDQAEAWMAVCRALGGLRGPGSTGKEIAVSMIRELQRKALRLDQIMGAVQAP